MDEHLSDGSIDQIVRSTLAAEPASDFVSRVRAQIPGSSSAVILNWLWAPLAGIAVVGILIVGVLIRSSEPVSQSLPIIARTTEIVGSVVRPVLNTPKPALPERAARSHQRVVRGIPKRTEAPESPEVLVPPDQMLTIRALLKNMNKYEFSFAEESAQARSEIAIQPIVIEPLRIDSVNGGLVQ